MKQLYLQMPYLQMPRKELNMLTRWKKTIFLLDLRQIQIYCFLER